MLSEEYLEEKKKFKKYKVFSEGFKAPLAEMLKTQIRSNHGNSNSKDRAVQN